MTKRWLLAGVLAALALVGGWSKAGNDSAPAKKQMVYAVKYASAKELASSLGSHFKGAVDVQVVPDRADDCLLLTAPAAALDEAAKLLEQLDHRPQVVAVEVFIVAVPVQGGAGEKEPDEKDFTGPAAAVVARMQDMQKKGRLGELKRIELKATENEEAALDRYSSRPFVKGVRAEGGKMRPDLEYRSLGLAMSLTPHVTAEKTISLELVLRDDRRGLPENGKALGNDDSGKPIRATEFITAKAETDVTVAPGQAVPVKGVTTTCESGKEKTLVVVTARVLESKAPGGK
jgi:type II secretory pathway component GspD/PulD (secretin)